MLLYQSIVITLSAIPAQRDDIRLLVRIDDMGFSHSANVACIDAFKNGIARSVEVIVPGPWFEEAAILLNENPELDAGVHLTLTSEWKTLKWRPLTHCPSLTDNDGYFYPMIWKNDRFPEGSFLNEAEWKLDEIEKEWRAQIELAQKKIPHISHLSGHMGCVNLSEETRSLFRSLALEYDLIALLEESGVMRAPSWSGNEFSAKQKEQGFIKMLRQLTPGDWYTIEHPAYQAEELKTIGHAGYDNVGEDRAGVTSVLTSKRVKKVIFERGITLISYLDLKLNR